MKLLSLKFIKGEYDNPLDGFVQNFHKIEDLGNTTPICLAGVNGSGKSKLLEILADIFYYLDHYFSDDSSFKYKTSLQFELEYVLENARQNYIRISQNDLKGFPIMERLVRNKWEEIKTRKDGKDYLPKHIVGYSSGDNETLSKRFEDSYLEYSEAVTDLEKNPTGTNVPDTRLVFLDYKVNSYVFIANSVFREKQQLQLIEDKIEEMNGLESFRIIIQEKPRYKNGATQIRLTPELRTYINSLEKCATCSFYEPKNKKTILDFYLNEQTKKLIKAHFDSAFQFYTSLYKLDLLNDILLRNEKKAIIRNTEYPNQKNAFPILSPEDKVFNIENIRVNLKSVDHDVDYYDLSDGEYQLIHVLGSILMIDVPDTLFLMDEPETHFNPQWRSKFISTLNTIKHIPKQDFFITTHSPFILGDCQKQHVLIFEEGKSRNPDVQTYGLSMERILKEAFGVVPPMSEKALEDIKKLQKSTSIKNIESRIDEFGESIEKLYLFNHLGELKKTKRKPLKK
jgi:restriction system-associated AAA family ATPase